MKRITLNRNGQISPKGRETSDLKAGRFQVGEHVMLGITGEDKPLKDGKEFGEVE